MITFDRDKYNRMIIISSFRYLFFPLKNGANPRGSKLMNSIVTFLPTSM